MKLEKFYLSLFVITIIINSSLASATPKPCPEVAKIISVGINIAYLEAPGWVATYIPNYEYTKNTPWNFVLVSNSAINQPASREEALARAVDALSSLKFSKSTDTGEYTICEYITGMTDVNAMAITPATFEFPDNLTLVKIILR